MRKVFQVDGVWHEVGATECCRPKPCWCGGKIHRQGEFKECDSCGRALPRLHSTSQTLQQLNLVR